MKLLSEIFFALIKSLQDFLHEKNASYRLMPGLFLYLISIHNHDVSGYNHALGSLKR